MWNCHSSPLHVSNNLSGYCISKLVLVSAFGICMCIYALVFPYIFLLVDCFKRSSHWLHWKVQSSLCALAVLNGGVYHKFYFSLYFLISWLFQMGSHWSHWKAKSSLCPLAVSNGGSIVSFTFPYIFLLVDCFEWALIGHIEKQRVHSVLWQFWMGGLS